MKIHLCLISFCALTACGGDALDPGSGDELGSGTKTLLIDGTASASPRIVGATADDFDTDISIRIELNGSDVTTGTVTVASRFTSVPLAFTGNNRWEGRAAGYDQTYQLDVISGNDEVRGVIVDGPDLHHITAPTAGASLDSTVAIELKWDRDDAADIITFRSDAIDRIAITDSGTYSMGPATLKAEKDKTRENTLELRRTNHVVPAGAIGGSDFAVSVEQRVDVIAQPNPAL
jgi:hypothetical protein